jgi:hypothetical protein
MDADFLCSKTLMVAAMLMGIMDCEYLSIEQRGIMDCEYLSIEQRGIMDCEYLSIEQRL